MTTTLYPPHLLDHINAACGEVNQAINTAYVGLVGLGIDPTDALTHIHDHATRTCETLGARP